MAQTIRGLTVEISADASKFNKQMSAIRKEAKTSQTELNALQKSLELKFDSTKLVQAQKKAQSAIDATAEKAQVLRERLKFLEDGGNVDTSHYRQIQSELAQCELQAQQLQKQLEKINQVKFDNVTNNIKNVGNGISNFGRSLAPISAAAAATLSSFGALGLKAASTGAEIDDLSLRFGVSAEKIQEWQYLAVQTGVDVEIFNKALVKARASMLDLATGTENNATKAIRNLGLDIKNFASNEDMFDGIISAMANMEDKTLQAAYANEIFGDKVATQMLPFLNTGTEELNKFKEEFASMGALSNEQVSALAKLDDTLFLLKESLKNVALQIGASFAPLLEKLANTLQNNLIPKLQQLAGWFDSLSVSQQEMIAKALLLVAALSPVIMLVGKLTTTVGSMIGVLKSLGSALTSLEAHPIILIIAAVAAILVILYTKCEAFRESINNLVSTLMNALQPIMETIWGLLSTLMELLTPIIEMLGQILAVVINLVVDALAPFFEILSLIFELLQPILQVALIPLQLALQALQVPLQIIGQLLGWLSPLFTAFANVVKSVFSVVLKVINFVLGVVEDAVNFCIRIINGLIDGVNAALGWLGVHIEKIGEVSLKVDTGELDNLGDTTVGVDAPYQTYDKIGSTPTSNTSNTTNYSEDNSQYNIEVNLNATGNLDYDAKSLADEVIKQIVTKKQATGR